MRPINDKKLCERCGEDVAIIKHEYHDDEGEKQTKWLCWDCDFDIMNGRGDEDDDMWEVQSRHAEEDYEFDPTYYPKPNWLQ